MHVDILSFVHQGEEENFDSPLELLTVHTDAKTHVIINVLATLSGGCSGP